MKRLFLIIILCLFSSSVFSAVEHQLIRRITVFPMSVKAKYTKKAEGTWWKVRERLTDDKRFLVASRSFLVKKDVYQARSKLTPADAIILGQLLDAHALITTFLYKRELHMHVYEGNFGQLLWKSKIKLHPSLPIKNQLEKSGVKLINDFIASFPYQGYIFTDKFEGKAVIADGADYLVNARVGLSAKLKVGDKIQIIKLEPKDYKPLFQSSAEFIIQAEGVVTKAKKGVIMARLDRHIPVDLIKEFDLVRIPTEYQRLYDLFKINNGLTSKISSEYYSPEITETSKEVKEKKPLVTALTIILNVAVFLLLAL